MAEKKGLWSSLRSVFGGKDEAPSFTVAHKTDEDHWVEISLDQMLASDPDTPVHVVTLQQYRDALADHWTKLEPKVMMLAESILRRVTRHGGVLSQKDVNFLIVFKPSFQDGGTKQVADAAIELGQRLVGAKFSLSQGSGPSVACAVARAADILGASGAVDLGKLRQIANAAEAVILPGQSPQMQTIATPGHKPIQVANVETLPPETPADWEAMRHKSKPQADIKMVTIEPPRKKRPEPEWVPMKRD